ncbi:unnamed protein product, partial [marine sediment metagenome]
IDRIFAGAELSEHIPADGELVIRDQQQLKCVDVKETAASKR